MRAPRLLTALAVCVAAPLAWAGAAGAQPAADPPAQLAAKGGGGPVPAPPTARVAWTGRVLAPVTARAAPRRSARAKAVLQPIAPLGKGATVVLITRTVVRDGERWVEVLLPVRPNGSRGWVPADVLRIRSTPVRIVIDVGDRRLTVYRAGRVAMRAPVAVGVPATPTPLGDWFAIAERIRTNTPGAFLGPIVMPITGYSEQLNEFAGGNGRVAIHGTSLPQLIGTAVSHGCIRMYNSDIVRLSRLAGPGTPVKIRP
jgi:lipoprotein-anchoring transpeptidase ErfK/SrfK